MAGSTGKGGTVSRVEALLTPVAAECGVKIWDVEFVKEGGEQILRVTIDRPEGIDSDLCYHFTELANPVIDADDPIQVSYMFEVSSAGLGRRLRRPEHFTASLGTEVTVRLIRPRNGEREIVGLLSGFDGDTISLAVSGGEEEISLKDAAYVKYNDDNDLF